MNCTKCNTEITPGNKFCKSCGTAVVKPQESLPDAPAKKPGAHVLPVVLLLGFPAVLLLGESFFLPRNGVQQQGQVFQEQPILVNLVPEKPTTPTTRANLPEKNACDCPIDRTEEVRKLQTEVEVYKSKLSQSHDEVSQLQNQLADYKAQANQHQDMRSLRDELSKLQSDLAACRANPPKCPEPNKPAAGPQLVFNVRHQHRGGGECQGLLEFFPGRIVFRSNEPSHAFDVPANEVAPSFQARLAKRELQIRLVAAGQRYRFIDTSSDDPEVCRTLRQMQLDCRQESNLKP